MCGRLEGFVRAEGRRYDVPFKSTNQVCRSCSARRHPVEIEARTAWSSFTGLSDVMVAASSSKLTAQDVEDAVETRKREITQIAGYTNERDIYKRHFCLCPSCHRRPLLQRLVARTTSTVHRHRDKDPYLKSVRSSATGTLSLCMSTLHSTANFCREMLRNREFCLCDHTQLPSRCFCMLFSVQALRDLHEPFQVPCSAEYALFLHTDGDNQPDMCEYPHDRSCGYHSDLYGCPVESTPANVAKRSEQSVLVHDDFHKR